MRWKFLGLLVLVFGLLLFPGRQEEEVLAPTSEDSRTFFGGAVAVAQEFMAPPGLSSIRIPVGINSQENGTMVLHLRERLDGQDIRTISISEMSGGEYTFSFRPLVRAGGKKLVWVLEAPSFSNKSAWVYREQDESAFGEGPAYAHGRQVRGNFGFTLVRVWPRSLLLGEEVLSGGDQARRTGWELSSILAGVVAAGGYLIFKKKPFALNISDTTWLGIIVAGSILLHIATAMVLPVVHDEGAYIQDARQAAEGLVPFRDVLTKGPLFLFLLYGWQFIIPNAIVGWRLLAAAASVLAIVGMWLLSGELGFPRRQRLAACGLLGLLPGAIGLTSPLLLQVVATPLIIFALWFVSRGARYADARWLMYGALLTNAAYFTRVSGAVAGAVGAILILLISKRRWRDVGIYLTSGLIFFSVVFGVSYLWLGWEKTAVMFNFEAALVSQQRFAVAQQISAENEPIIRQLVIGARYLWQTAPLLLSSFLLWPLLWLSRQRPVRSLLWLAAAVALAMPTWRHLVDTQFLLPFGSSLVTYTIIGLMFVAPTLFGMVQFFYGQRWQPDKAYIKHVVWLLVWLAMLAFAYGQWGRFRQNYLTEFLPPLILFFVLTYAAVFAALKTVPARLRWLPSLTVALVVALMTSSVVQGYYVLFLYPITGTIDQPSLQAIVRLVQEEVPDSTPIFTAQPIITAFADRPIMFGYSHPGWYREAKLGTLPPQLLSVFFQDPAKLTDYLAQEAQFVVMEGRTEEIYFDGYPGRREILGRSFERVAEADNAQEGEKVILYKRKATTK